MKTNYKREIGDLLAYPASLPFPSTSTEYHIVVGFDQTEWDDEPIPVYRTFNLNTNKYCTYGRKVVEEQMHKVA